MIMKNRKQVICEFCGKSFLSSYKNARVCKSESCKKKRNTSNATKYYHLNEKPSRIGFPGIPEGTVGAIAELFIATDLLSRGYSVFRSLSQSCFCDLIGIKGNKVLKIECKTGHRNLSTKRLVFLKTNKDMVDVYAVYVFGEKSITYFDAKSKVIIHL